MKKTLVVATVACACALAASADVGSFFKGITNGSASGTGDLEPSGGAWAFGTGDYTVTGGVVGFDLDDDQAMAFNVSAAAGDTNTVTYVTVTGDFTPVRVADFPTNGLMGARSAKVGFLVGVTDTPTVATNYYAWVGTNGNVGDATWFALSGAVTNGETALVAKFDYRFTTATVSFGIVGGSTTNWLENSSSVSAFTFSAGVDRQVAGISCYGSGTLSKADGDVELAVATVTDAAGAADGVAKYGTLAEAADAATSGNTITVVRSTSESVTLENGVTISDPANNATGTISADTGATISVVPSEDDVDGTNGTYVITLKVTAEDADHIDIKLADGVEAHKEVANKVLDKSNNKLTFDLQTLASILQAVQPDGKNAVNLIPNNKVDKLRAFIKSDAGLNAADVSAAVTSESLGSALAAVANDGNGLAKWQSFVLGVKPSESVAPEANPAGDINTGSISLSIVAATNEWAGASNYTVSYKYLVGEDETPIDGATAANITLSNLPSGAVTSKVYSVKATLKPNN